MDTEFDDSGENVELISLGAVSSDDREFYAVSNEFDPETVKPWVRQNVLPLLPPRDSGLWMPMDEIKKRFLEYVGEREVEFWSLNPTYDWYLVTWHFFGGWDHIPSGWPYECFDLRQWAFHLNVSIPKRDVKDEHNALMDARHHREIYDYLARKQEY